MTAGKKLGAKQILLAVGNVLTIMLPKFSQILKDFLMKEKIPCG